MPRRSADLLVGFLEQVSWRVLAEYPDIVRTLIRRRSGIDALYKQDKLYYVGLASNLLGRVNGHLDDRHHGAWDRFSVYLTSNDAYIKPLESLLLRIARPSGNRVSGGFGRSINLYRPLHRSMADADADRRAWILGGHVARRLRRRRTRDARGSLVLAGLVDRRLTLRARWKGRRFKQRSGATVTSASRAGSTILLRLLPRRPSATRRTAGFSGTTGSRHESGCPSATFADRRRYGTFHPAALRS
jgi:hypothetical protein